MPEVPTSDGASEEDQPPPEGADRRLHPPTGLPTHTEHTKGEDARRAALRSIAGRYTEFYYDGYLEEIREGWDE